MAGKIPQQFIDELLSRTDIVELINQRVPLKKAGREYQACCPFHTEKTPSFTVSPAKQFYHCFGCGAHGTAIGFLMEYERLSFPEAVEELAARQGLEIPREITFEQGPDHRPLYALLEQVDAFYREQLHAHPDSRRARDYLAGRGLSEQVIETFDIGFAPPGWDNVLARFGKNDQSRRQLAEAGLTTTNEKGRTYDRLRERIIFPIHDGRGRVIGFGGRLLGDGKPKYLNSPETPIFHKGRELYGLYQARQAHRQLERILVVEGYMDVVALAQYEIRNAVATLGTATTAEHLNKLYRACNEVVFCFDGDRAGRAAAWKALETALPLMKDGRQARFLFLPEGEDPDTLVRKIGRQAFLDEVARAQPLSEFLFARLETQTDMGSIDGRARLAELARPLLAKLPTGTFRAMMEQALTERVGVHVAVPVSEATPPPPRPRPTRGHKPGGMPPMRRAIALLLQHPEAARAELPEGWETLQTPGIEVLRELLERIRAHPDTHSAALVEATADERLRGILAQLAVAELAVQDDAAEQLAGILRRLIEKQRAEQREALLKSASLSTMSEEEKQRLRELYRRP
ncbi:DNA primase [endosymbiont of unidentified scaly snail isolate Monju]|uniref:DNA primase n=1 Tax=endosymbiont of unidentified scaly snail isolate Monju TaxID=1248727 RepID=UPI0003892842|nr:DNA primase [endosymbiont of unidentified scaly snail isolate Monju]BAN68494.1 DNA primase [endosymbiont of unidentified scaly snail isolate Monju]